MNGNAQCCINTLPYVLESPRREVFLEALNNVNLTLPVGVPIDVAGHEPTSCSVFGSTLFLLEGEVHLLIDVVTLLQSWPSSSAFSLDHALQ